MSAFRGSGWTCEACGRDCTRHVWRCNACALRFISKDKAGNEVSVLGPCPRCCAYRGAELMCPRHVPWSLVAAAVVAVLIAAAAVGLMHCGGEPFSAAAVDSGTDVALDAAEPSADVDQLVDSGTVADVALDAAEPSADVEQLAERHPDVALVDAAADVEQLVDSGAHDARSVSCTTSLTCPAPWSYSAPCRGVGVCCTAQVCP